MKVEIMSGIVWDGEHRDPGDIIDVKPMEANWLISRGRAKVADEIAETINRAVAIPTSEQPKLSKRTWKKSSAA
jgi:hypothetical protein